jgi:predicted O-methyltransferase YrrM
MSQHQTKIDNVTERYLNETFALSLDSLEDLLNESIELGFPQITISPLQANFLYFFLKSINAKYVLEIGSLFGYSAFSMASALTNDGTLIAIEKNSFYAEYIKNKAKEIGLEKKLFVVNQEAKDFLENFEPNYEFDFIFLDADKKNYPYYFGKSIKLLRKGGIIACDNALAFGELMDKNPKHLKEDIESLKEFNNLVTQTEGFIGTIIPLGDGIAMGMKL